VWTEADTVRLGRFDARRAPLDGDGIAVAAVAYAMSPRIAGNGIDDLVTWISGPQLFGRIVTRDGNVAGDAFAISAPSLPYGTDSDVAWDGSRFIVSWDGGGFASVTPGGTVAPLVYSTGTGTQSVARFSAGPRPLLVNTRTVAGVATIVSGNFLDDGTTFDVTRESTFNPPNKTLLSNAHAASNGRDYLVTWSRANDATHFSEAWMARVDRSGKVIAGPIVAANAASSTSKAQAIPLFDGADYRVVVHGDAHPLAEAVVSDATFACGCLDALDLPFEVGPTATFGRLAAAAGGRGQAAVSYDRLVIDPFIAYRERVFLRLLGYPAPRHRASAK
ncbi:MAG TPA: hypothetical protein VG323_00635, partial [Thermoanaerobaculia bacterium]|nr:hypothetical protein [Thermoanaerobaculia bacterium]